MSIWHMRASRQVYSALYNFRFYLSHHEISSCSGNSAGNYCQMELKRKISLSKKRRKKKSRTSVFANCGFRWLGSWDSGVTYLVRFVPKQPAGPFAEASTVTPGGCKEREAIFYPALAFVEPATYVCPRRLRVTRGHVVSRTV